jgi:hypothetical protein
VDCRRTGTVEEYQDRFQALLPRAGHLDEAQWVQLFTGGLLPPLSLDVRVHNPQSLAAAMSLARQLELREQYTPAAAKAPSRGVLPSPPPRFALPAAPAEKPAPTTIPVGEQPVKRLSRPEQEERRRLGLCFNCNEKYTRGHNRVCRRIFYIGGFKIGDEARDADDPGPEAPVFSLHAIAGVAVGNTV